MTLFKPKNYFSLTGVLKSKGKKLALCVIASVKKHDWMILENKPIKILQFF